MLWRGWRWGRSKILLGGLLFEGRGLVWLLVGRKADGLGWGGSCWYREKGGGIFVKSRERGCDNGIQSEEKTEDQYCRRGIDTGDFVTY